MRPWTWYRTLGAQQQIADEPGDLLILSENRQIANQVVGLAFDVARASADQLVEGPASAASGNQGNDPAQASAAQTLAARQHKLDAQALSVQNEIDSTRAGSPARRKRPKPALQSKIAELQGELDLSTRRKACSAASRRGERQRCQGRELAALPDRRHGGGIAGHCAPRRHGDARTAGGATPGRPAASAPRPPRPRVSASGTRPRTYSSCPRRFPRSTRSIGAPTRCRPRWCRSRTSSSRNCARFRRAATRSWHKRTATGSAGLGVTRDQLDTLANQFKQASVLFVPLKKQAALLDQYRRNLKNWRDTVKDRVARCARVSGNSSRRARAHPGRGVRPCRAVASRRAQIRAGFAQALSALASCAGSRSGLWWSSSSGSRLRASWARS
jgi:hypothetical protein